MFGATGTGLAAIRTWQNDGKRPRYSLDQWDKVSINFYQSSFDKSKHANMFNSKVRLPLDFSTNV